MAERTGTPFLNKDFFHLLQKFSVLQNLPHDIGVRFSIENTIGKAALTHYWVSSSVLKYIILDKKHNTKEITLHRIPSLQIKFMDTTPPRLPLRIVLCSATSGGPNVTRSRSNSRSSDVNTRDFQLSPSGIEWTDPVDLLATI